MWGEVRSEARKGEGRGGKVIREECDHLLCLLLLKYDGDRVSASFDRRVVPLHVRDGNRDGGERHAVSEEGGRHVHRDGGHEDLAQDVLDEAFR